MSPEKIFLYFKEGLYKALSSNGNPAFSTAWNNLRAVSYTLIPTPLSKAMQYLFLKRL